MDAIEALAGTSRDRSASEGAHVKIKELTTDVIRKMVAQVGDEGHCLSVGLPLPPSSKTAPYLAVRVRSRRRSGLRLGSSR